MSGMLMANYANAVNMIQYNNYIRQQQLAQQQMRSSGVGHHPHAGSHGHHGHHAPQGSCIEFSQFIPYFYYINEC